MALRKLPKCMLWDEKMRERLGKRWREEEEKEKRECNGKVCHISNSMPRSRV